MTQPTAPLQKARPKELAAALKARYPVLAVGMVIEIQGALFRVQRFGKTILTLETLNGAEIVAGRLTEEADALVKRALAGKGDPLWLRIQKWLGLVH